MKIKKIIEEKCNIIIDSIKLIGEGYDSKAYIVNMGRTTNSRILIEYLK